MGAKQQANITLVRHCKEIWYSWISSVCNPASDGADVFSCCRSARPCYLHSHEITVCKGTWAVKQWSRQILLMHFFFFLFFFYPHGNTTNWLIPKFRIACILYHHGLFNFAELYMFEYICTFLGLKVSLLCLLTHKNLICPPRLYFFSFFSTKTL